MSGVYKLYEFVLRLSRAFSHAEYSYTLWLNDGPNDDILRACLHGGRVPRLTELPG